MNERFVALKLAEECSELSAVLIQYYCFGRKSEARVTSEMGDVQAWLETLKLLVDKTKVEKASLEKLKVIRGYENGKIPVTFNDPRGPATTTSANE